MVIINYTKEITIGSVPYRNLSINYTIYYIVITLHIYSLKHPDKLDNNLNVVIMHPEPKEIFCVHFRIHNILWLLFLCVYAFPCVVCKLISLTNSITCFSYKHVFIPYCFSHRYMKNLWMTKFQESMWLEGNEICTCAECIHSLDNISNWNIH